MKAKKFLGIVALFLLTGFGVTAMCRVALADNKETQTIYAGVYLDGVYVGGLTKEEAMEEYDKNGCLLADPALFENLHKQYGCYPNHLDVFCDAARHTRDPQPP